MPWPGASLASWQDQKIPGYQTVLIRISARLFQAGPLITYTIDVYNYRDKSEARRWHVCQGMYLDSGWPYMYLLISTSGPGFKRSKL
jgi:hypothetical protein